MQYSSTEFTKYRDTITQFLKDNTLYDCLSHNNQLVVLDQTFSCWEVFQIFIENNLEEALFWNQDVSNYDGVFTHTDLIKVLLKFYGNAFQNKSSIQQSGPKMNVIEEEAEFQDEETNQSQQTIQWPDGLNEEQKLRLLYEMKTITIRQWFRLLNDDPDQQIGLVQGRMDERLYDACFKITKSGISRLFVIEPESKMFMGIIHQKDILVFLIKGFTQYENAAYKQQNNQLQQHQLTIRHFYSQMHLAKEVFTCNENQTVYQVFYTMMYSHKAYLIPIVNNQNQYVGSISRKDIVLVIKNGLFEMFSQTVAQLMQFLHDEKKKIPAYVYNSKQFFTMEQTVKEVVENIVLSESSALICLAENNTIQEIITIADIFKFLLKEEL